MVRGESLTELKKIGFIGFGNMGSSIYRAAERAGFLAPEDVAVFEVAPSRVPPNIRRASDIGELYSISRRILIAVKPANLDEVLSELSVVYEKAREGGPSSVKTLMTIVAGVPLSYYRVVLGGDVPLVRIMPNTPLLVGEGFSAISFTENVPEEELKFVKELFGKSGDVELVEEKLMDAITGFTGSGPGFIFLLINAFAEGGTYVGIPKEKSVKMAARVFLGAARMVLETGLHPEQLKDMVASPGGTTVEGLKALEEYRVRASLIEAVRRATEKSSLISQKMLNQKMLKRKSEQIPGG